MIYTYLTGRVGNNLFQLATAAALAHRNKDEFTAIITKTWCQEPDKCYLEEYLKQFEKNLFRNIKKINFKPKDITVFDQVLRVEQIPYFPNICIHGLWQSENYFVNEQSLIRNLFSIDENTELFIKKKYGKVFMEEVISIVIRRGDYVKQPQFHPTCSIKYYKNAIRYFGKNKQYLIISDDLNWCRKKFKGSNFFFSDSDGPPVDLYLQTFSTHNIISNSTFAWWGAWLNSNPNKIVVAPKDNWFGYFYKNFYRPDMFPESWKLIPNPLSIHHKAKVLFAIFITKIVPFKHYIERKFNLSIKIFNKKGIPKKEHNPFDI